jgi:hypothetical protein
MVHEVDAPSGSRALQIRKGMIARPTGQPDKYLVFERVDDAIGHPSAILSKGAQ